MFHVCDIRSPITLNLFNLKMALGCLHIPFYKALPIKPDILVQSVSSRVLLSVDFHTGNSESLLSESPSSSCSSALALFRKSFMIVVASKRSI